MGRYAVLLGKPFAHDVVGLVLRIKRCESHGQGTE